MEVKITEKQDNRLLSRLELKGTVSFSGPTPSYAQLQSELNKALKSKEELIVVKNIYTDYGSASACFEAFVYDSTEALSSVERQRKTESAKPAEGEASE